MEYSPEVSSSKQTLLRIFPSLYPSNLLTNISAALNCSPGRFDVTNNPQHCRVISLHVESGRNCSSGNLARFPCFAPVTLDDSSDRLQRCLSPIARTRLPFPLHHNCYFC